MWRFLQLKCTDIQQRGNWLRAFGGQSRSFKRKMLCGSYKKNIWAVTQHLSHHEKQRVLSEMFFPPCMGKHLFLITRKKKKRPWSHMCLKSLKAMPDSVQLINLLGQWRMGQDLHSHILLPGERLVPVLPTMQHWNNLVFCCKEWSAHVLKLGLQDSEKKHSVYSSRTFLKSSHSRCVFPCC